MTVGRGRSEVTAATVEDVVVAIPHVGGLTALAPHRIMPQQPAHGLLLLALAELMPAITRADGPDSLHVALAYAFPVVLDPAWRSWAAGNCAALVAGGQLVTTFEAQLVAADPSRATTRRHARLHRAHAGTTVHDHGDIDGFLADWSAFAAWRYSESPTPELVSALRSVLVMTGCRIRDFRHGGEVIARSVVAHHERTRTLFDLMAVWWPRHARLRPGIYSAVFNIHDAQQRGLRYSLCYGRFPYKDHILGDLPRLSLGDLAGRP